MKIISTQKFIRTSPRKLRFVADMVREMSPNHAVEVLPQIGKRAGEPLSKVIKSAIANAKIKGFSEGDLTIGEIQIGDGPRLKRGRPVSRGRWHPVLKRMSHIRVVLEAQKSEARSSKSKTKVKAQAKKKVAKNKLTKTRQTRKAKKT